MRRAAKRLITQLRAPLDEPFGQRLLTFSTALPPVCVDGYMAQTLPCIKHQQKAAKIYEKGQQTLIYEIIFLKN